MEISALPIKLTKEEAINVGQNGRGSFLSRLFVKNKKVHEVRLHYIEFKLVTLEVKYDKFGLRKKCDKVHKLNILINGSTGSGSIVQDMPKTIRVKGVGENIVQFYDKDDQRIRSKANKMAMRITHRFMGGTPDINIIKIESFFRPYWVLFFGEVKENTRVGYLPVEADGFIINRVV